MSNPNLFDISEKAAIVTGAASGLGGKRRACCTIRSQPNWP